MKQVLSPLEGEELPPLREWQRAELFNTRNKLKTGLCASPRLGKSRVAIEFIAERLTDGYGLLLAPLAVCDDLTRLLRVRGISVYPGYKDTSKGLLEAFKGHPRNTVCVLNYDKLQSVLKLVLADPPEVLVCDESHYIRGASSARGKAARKVADRSKHVLLMTGTIAPNGVQDLWGQSSCIDPKTWGTSYTGYQRRHLVVDQMMYNKVIGIKDPNVLKDMLTKTWSFWKREDVFGPDSWVYTERAFDLPKEARSLYDKLAKEWILSMEEQELEIDATHVLSRMVRLQQLTSGFLPNTMSEDCVIHKAKLDLVVQDLEDIVLAKEKAVIFHRYRKEEEMLVEATRKLGCPVYTLSGGDAPGDRTDKIRRFNESDLPAVFIVQTQAGGVGISLASATHALFYSQMFSFDQELQARDRIYSPGKVRCVTYYRARRSIDMYIAQIIESKDTVHNAIRSANIHEIAYCEQKHRAYNYG